MHEPTALLFHNLQWKQGRGSVFYRGRPAAAAAVVLLCAVVTRHSRRAAYTSPVSINASSVEQQWQQLRP